VKLRELTRADTAEVQAVYDRAEDYFVLVTGAPAPPEEAAGLWDGLPPDSDPAKLSVHAICEPETVGVAAVLRDWPRRGTWLIGLLLLEPAARGRGLGARVVAQVEARARAAAGDRLRVAVIESNAPGLAFWRRLGFTPVPPSRGSSALAFERAIAAPSGRTAARPDARRQR
jgi:GNAT superfamily N-acetyltransferase